MPNKFRRRWVDPQDFIDEPRPHLFVGGDEFTVIIAASEVQQRVTDRCRGRIHAAGEHDHDELHDHAVAQQFSVDFGMLPGMHETTGGSHVVPDQDPKILQHPAERFRATALAPRLRTEHLRICLGAIERDAEDFQGQQHRHDLGQVGRKIAGTRFDEFVDASRGQLMQARRYPLNNRTREEWGDRASIGGVFRSVHLECGSNARAAAELLYTHKNTVHYRLERAAALLGHPITQRRLELELALRIVATYGDTILDEA